MLASPAYYLYCFSQYTQHDVILCLHGEPKISYTINSMHFIISQEDWGEEGESGLGGQCLC